MKHKDWMKEFKIFLTSEPVSPPWDVENRVKSRILSLMEVSVWQVFGKLMLVHTFVGTLTLLVCNQFGFGLSDFASALTGKLMSIHHSLCMSFCGAAFLALSVVVSIFILNSAEVLKFRETLILQVAAASIVSLGVFVFVPSTVVTIGMALPWLAGAVFSGYLVARITFVVRSRSLVI